MNKTQILKYTECRMLALKDKFLTKHFYQNSEMCQRGESSMTLGRRNRKPALQTWRAAWCNCDTTKATIRFGKNL